MFFNRRIQFISYSSGSDGRGGQTAPVPSVYWETNAYEEPMTQTRKLEDNQGVLSAATVFNLRYRRDKFPTQTMMLKELHTGSFYTIHSVLQKNDDREYLEVRAMLKQ